MYQLIDLISFSTLVFPLRRALITDEMYENIAKSMSLTSDEILLLLEVIDVYSINFDNLAEIQGK